MTSKRKADIQRKLTLASVPRPPEDLAERIKSDIPKYLNVEAERERFSRSVGFNLRMAASIIVLISIAAMMFVFMPQRERGASMVQMKRATPQVSAATSTAATTATTAMNEVQVEIAQETAAVQSAPVQIASAEGADAQVVEPAAPPARLRRDDDFADEPARQNREESTVGSGVVGGVVGSREDYVQATAEAPAMAPPPAADFAPAPAPAPVPPPESARATTSSKMADSRAPRIVSEAYAAELPLAPKSVFGLSVDPEVFRRIKTTIESGQRPAPSTVNVEALVNYFAGPPARRVRSGVRLEVEGSPAPVDVNGRRGILRFTIDTASMTSKGSVPPVATDARLEIEFNSDAVSRFTPVGDRIPTTESALLHNVSVTGLYELDLRAPLKEKQIVATIRLHYRSLPNGKSHTIERILRGADFAHQWSRSTRRHRLASLGALWAESLRGTGGGTDVARRAEELASQAPNDERARELADVASASSGGLR